MLTVYKASAGSGKTFTLTREYLLLLLGVPRTDAHGNRVPTRDADGNIIPGNIHLNHPDFDPARRRRFERDRHRGILAITFTNKATEEMKARIVSELKKIAVYDPAKSAPESRSDYADDFIAIFGCTERQLGESASAALRDLLRNYSDFNVSTIDSFFQLILRNMAYELDLAGDYEVSLDNNAIVAEAVKMLLDEFNSQPNPDLKSGVGAILRDHIRYLRAKGSAINIFNRKDGVYSDIIRNAETIYREDYRNFQDEFNRWLEKPDSLSRFKAQLKKDAEDAEVVADEAIDNLGKAIDKAAASGLHINGSSFKDIPAKLSRYTTAGQSVLTAAMKNNFTGDVLTEADALHRKLALGYTIPSAAENPVFITKMFSGWTKKAVDNDTFNTAYGILRLFNDALAAIGRRIAVTLAEESVATYRFMSQINRNVRTFLNANNIINLSDTADIIAGIIGNGEDQVPFIYEKMGTRIHSLLIDEFQDTSRMQWNNLRPLVINGVAEDNDSLIIGDAKQAIYRFRNSDATLLEHDVPADPGIPDKVIRGNRLSENTNWRSAADIVRFNNTLFARMADTRGLSTIYSNVIQNIAPKNLSLPGYVHLIPFAGASSKAKGTEEASADKVEKPSMEDTLVKEIQRQRMAGYRYREIAVLVNVNKQTPPIAQRLLAEGIPVCTNEALLVSKSTAVSLIISVMRSLVETPAAKDNTRAKETPYSSMRRRLDRGVFLNRFEILYNRSNISTAGGDNAGARALEQAFAEAGADDTVADTPASISEAAPSSLTSLVEYIVSEYIPERQRLAEAPFIAALHDAVLNFQSQYSGNIVEFLRWWDIKSEKLSVSTPEDIDAVRVMTIHSSKGLEFPCVHIPDANWDFEGNKQYTDSIWLDTKALSGDYPPAMLFAMSAKSGFPGSPLAARYEENRRLRIVDGFNKTYVAFTRAGRELIVYYNPSKGCGCDITGALRTVGNGDLAPAGLQASHITVDTEHLIDNTGEFIFGEPTVPDRTKELEEEKKKRAAEAALTDEERVKAEADHQLYSHIDEYVVSISPGDGLTSLRASVEEDMSSVDSLPSDLDDDTTEKDGPDDRAASGTAIHNVLSRIETISDVCPAEGRSGVLDNAVSRHTISADEAESVRRFFTDPANAAYIRSWFGPGVIARNEMPIYHDRPARKGTGPDDPDEGQHSTRPDRVVMTTDGEIHILDYKTGMAPELVEAIDVIGTDSAPAPAAKPDMKHPAKSGQLRAYRRQLEGYRDSIAAIYPGRCIRTFLLFTTLNRILEVTPSV